MTPGADAARGGRARRAGLGILAALVALLVVEAFSWLYLCYDHGGLYLPSGDQRTRAAILDPGSSTAPPDQEIPLATPHAEVIHPFLGFVVDPVRKPGFTEQGFPATAPSAGPRGGEPLEVAVFGGSFAEGVVRQGGEILAEALAGGAAGGRRVTVRAYALGGYKQPQQLLALAWLLSLGEPVDLVINIDGFNEVALPGAENAGMVFPFYPRGWPARVSNFIDPAKLEMVAALSSLARRQTVLARRFSRFPLSWSPTANLVWRSLQRETAARRARVARELESYSARRHGELGYIARGPGFPYRGEEEMQQALSAHWMRSSLEMRTLAAGSGIPYFHFLQPNQYVPGSRELAPGERKTAFREDHPYREGVVRGYPLLQERGARLAAQGVSFHDLTGIFRGIPGAIYIDDCCHVSREGYAIVAREIARIINEAHPGLP